MAQMRVATHAGHLGADHIMAAVLMLFDHVIGQGRIKAWPAAARFELGRGVEQGRITAHTAIGAGALGKAGMAKGPFSCRAAGDLKGQFPKLRQPFGIGFHHLVHRLLLHGAARHCLLQTGALVARLAEGPEDIARAQELRHLCFRAARGLDRVGGREADGFDDLCQHVLIEDASGRLLGGFRAMILPADQIAGSYSAQFYDLTPISTQPGPMMELGRFCTHPEASDPDVLRLALAAITRLVEWAGVTLMFGCSSFAGADPARHAEALAHLGRHHLAPAGQGPGRRGVACVTLPNLAADPRRALAALPPLLRSYLTLGGWVSDHAVIVPDLDTLHVFTAVEVARIPPARARALRALVSAAAGLGQNS